MNKISTATSRHWSVVIGLAVLAGLVFVAPYLGAICLAALMAFLFYPLYRKVLKWVRRPSLAAVLTLLSSVIVIIIPVGAVLLFMFAQLGGLAQSLSVAYAEGGAALPAFVQSAIAALNNIAVLLGEQGSLLSSQGVIDFIRSTLPGIVNAIIAMLAGAVGSIPLAIILSIMYIILFNEFLIYGPQLIETIKVISPFDRSITTRYLDRIGQMAIAMAKGQLVISLIISFLSAGLMFFIGLGEYFFLFFVSFTLLNLVPLGCGIVVFPAAGLAMLNGDIVGGITVLVLYTLVSNLDNFIRPRIIPKSVQLSAGLTMLAAFGGIAYYGLLGVVYGPIVMIVIVTTINLYMEYHRGIKSEHTAPVAQ